MFNLNSPLRPKSSDCSLAYHPSVVAVLPFNEGGGAAFNVLRRRATDTTQPVWSKARYGHAVNDFAFSGADAELDWGTYAGPFSVITWFRCVTTPGAGHYPDIIQRGNYVGEANNNGWSLYAAASNDGFAPSKIVWRVSFNTATSLQTKSTTSLASGTDYFVVADANGGSGANNIKHLYVNGALEATNTNNGASTPGSQNTVGLRQISATEKNTLYCAVIIRAVLPATIITALYQAGPGALVPFVTERPRARLYSTPPAGRFLISKGLETSFPQMRGGLNG